MSSLPPQKVQESHWPQLDGLRTVAVMLVFLHHWTTVGSNLGIIGVQLFFVLSGFLITGILLRLRTNVLTGQQSVAFSLRQFYARRFLRIFPLYYACIFLFLVVDRFDIRETAPWHFLYLSNVLFFTRGEFGGQFSHFWSLAVEEQFYLFWPFAVLLIPARILPWALAAMIAQAPFFRWFIYAGGGQHFAQHSTLLPANLDTLGTGALAAWWLDRNGDMPARVRQSARYLVPVCLCAIIWMRVSPQGVSAVIFDPIAVAIVAGWIVVSATRGFRGPVGKLLSNPVMVFLGRISYGLYVWHMFAPAFLRNILNAARLPAEWNFGVIGFMLLFAGTVLTASLSWHLWEQPFNRLKRHFPYTKRTA